MKIKNKALKVIIWVLAVLLILAVLILAAGYSYLKFFILPKLNQNITNPDEKINVSDIAKDFGDKQIIDNIINFDKNSASDMLSIITELDEENKAKDSENASKTDDKNEEPENTVPIDILKEGTTAYQRIMNAATKEEISQGSAILAKIDMSKVNALRKSGDLTALKEYIQSRLSPVEISTALHLYNKYKHLL